MSRSKAATPAFPVRDLARPYAVYRGHLGFSVIASDAGFSLLASAAITLQLWVSGDLSWNAGDGGKPILSDAESFLAGTASSQISVTDIETIHQACDDARVVQPNGALKTADDGAMAFAILDFDRNLIAFFELD